MFDLISCLDLELSDAVESLLTRLVVSVGKIACQLGKTVDRSDDEALCKIYAQREDRDEESHEKRRDPERECSLDVGNVRHRYVNADIALASVVAVVNRNIR